MSRSVPAPSFPRHIPELSGLLRERKALRRRVVALWGLLALALGVCLFQRYVLSMPTICTIAENAK